MNCSEKTVGAHTACLAGHPRLAALCHGSTLPDHETSTPQHIRGPIASLLVVLFRAGKCLQSTARRAHRGTHQKTEQGISTLDVAFAIASDSLGLASISARFLFMMASAAPRVTCRRPAKKNANTAKWILSVPKAPRELRHLERSLLLRIEIS